MDRSALIAEALGVILQRSFRSGLHSRLTEDLGGAVDATTYPVISIIDRLGPSSSVRIAAEAGLDRSVVSRRIAALADAGLVVGRTDERDARVQVVSLTPQGRRVVDKMRRRLADAIEARLADWAPDEADCFARGLQRFAEQGPL
ncbi:MarR family winged helix-turn-helix transcriptional regulator [Mycolicibacterium goodii]|uniref:MarR family winged helix-turn-helix transcriptional regulator n=1 Tax=Mycolicibacterium goodii TaxID=134601 RepID=UPI000C26366D|nr:MarR family transcriptional regulator [Mycolicibacterium goodii]PJK19969.1 MarR family transcriptional regulator [Mycolicibacterium goodii]